MALTDTTVRNAKPKAKPYKLGDSGGLFLLVQPSGGRLWRLKYRIDGREKKLGLGTYPDVSLAAARAARDEARRQLQAGADPSFEKKRQKLRARANAANKFGDIAREYIGKRKAEGWSESTVAKAEWMLEHFAGNLMSFPVTEIEPPDILAVLKSVEAKGKLETARRLLQFSSRVFRHAVATARLASDPARDLRGALTAPKSKHYAAIVEPARVGELLRAIDGYEGNYITKFALELTPHVFVRPGELRQACWSEFDFEERVWTIPAGRMKMRKAHTVPLSRQAIALLTNLREIRGDRPGLVFRSIRTSARPISENTLNAALRRLGFAKDEMTAHGFRAMASTLLNEARDPKTKKALWKKDAIERALAHGDTDETRAAYHRGEHWDERVEMAQWWSDHLEYLRDGARIVAFKERS